MLQRQAVATGAPTKIDGDSVEGLRQDKEKIVQNRFCRVRITQRHIRIGTQVAPPVKLQIAGLEGAVMQGAVYVAGKAYARLNL